MNKNVFIGGQDVEPIEQPVSIPEGKVDTGLLGLADVEPPLEKYEEIKGVPYTAKYFEVDVNDKVKDIDNFVINEIQSKQLKPTVASYHEVIERVSNLLGISKNETEQSKIDKIASYIQIYDKTVGLPKLSKNPIVDGTEQIVSDEPPLNMYESIKGVPYTAKYLGIDVWNDITRNTVREIDQYVLQEIANKNFIPTVASYHEIMSRIMEFLQVSPNETENSKLERVSTFVKMKNKSVKTQKKYNKLLNEINQYISEEGMYGT